MDRLNKNCKPPNATKQNKNKPKMIRKLNIQLYLEYLHIYLFDHTKCF